jgi:thymidylate synthase (FAD)
VSENEGPAVREAEPQLYLAGRQHVNGADLDRFLADAGVPPGPAGAPAWGSDAPSDGERLTEVAGRLCYMSFANPRPGGYRAYVDNIKECGHGSTLEHAVWNVIACGVSRNLTHELVRHRAGWSYSQLSTRFCDSRETEFVCDEKVRADPELHRAWREHVRDALKLYDRIDAIVTARLLMAAESPAVLTRAERTSLRKQSRETARQVLPGCMATRIFCTFNGRSLRHFLEMRAAAGAAWEMRRFANSVYALMIGEAPALLADYVKLPLPDGTFELTTPWRKV